MPSPVIELHVNNHPGVMSHITGLFSRRAFNLEGILCGPVADGSRSVMLLMVNEDRRLSQLIKELERLHDIHEVSLRHDVDATFFDPMRTEA
ncbi:MAG: ACT domain-containing protein [Proteobacteria bacterium]|nr:ACT domain-containing protein [Pseudomonadota bacterium]MBU1611455.1 ACT domain-containing protein [Pseudomonadota bacterium]